MSLVLFLDNIVSLLSVLILALIPLMFFFFIKKLRHRGPVGVYSEMRLLSEIINYLGRALLAVSLVNILYRAIKILIFSGTIALVDWLGWILIFSLGLIVLSVAKRLELY